jgi:trehalose-6-phosphate hydrolase
MNKDKNWWKTAAIYQIYPKSFCDSSDKGTGDILGIISKLDYLQRLGIEAIWLTPVYQSPMIDNGYDISDYYSINPEFGTMADFELLLVEAHQRNIGIIMDIVVNHTSTEHQWFKSALGDKSSPYRDYYIWRDPVDGKEPNNWLSKFGGPAWELDPATGQYYLHLFAKEQADLNWENPQVRAEVNTIIEFWAKKGVDGFRLDVINLISKQQDFVNDDTGDGRRFYTDGPRVHEYLQEIAASVLNKYDSVTVGEMSSTTLEHCQQYSSLNGEELSMVFNFHHLKVDYADGDKWSDVPFDFLQLKAIFNRWQTGLNGQGWGALFWCNHDQPRIVSRFGDDQRYRQESAKMLAASIHMMQGTPYVYQGEEIAMTNPHYKQIGQYRDVESTNIFDLKVRQQKMDDAVMLNILAQKSRDNARTPMQWNRGQNAGFSAGKPWLELADNYHEINAQAAVSDPDSVFWFYQKLITLRKTIPVITTGNYVDLMPDHPQILCYARHSDQQVLLCINNYYGDTAGCVIPEQYDLSRARCLLSNYPQGMVNNQMSLKPYETKILLIDLN